MHASLRPGSIFLVIAFAVGMNACVRARASVPSDSVVSEESIRVVEDRLAQGLGASCASDEDCSWDDFCFPTRCVNATTPGIEQECEESAPPDGMCECNEHQCTFRPFDPPTRTSTEGGCTTDADCTIDVGNGRCYVASGRMAPIIRQGPLCTCNVASGQCEYDWVDPVPCETFADCWYSREPRLHPILAPSPRQAPFEPCVDGEIDSVCVGEEGARFCRVVAWDC